jgi:probable HAF family extracellular repeat protein
MERCPLTERAMQSPSQHHRYAFLLVILCASAFSQTFQYTSFQVPGSSHTAALGLNNSGEIVGSFVSNGQQAGFLYSGGTFQTIACPNASFTIAQGINDNGVIVGWCNPTGEAQGFIYQNGTYTYLSYPGSFRTVLNGVNDLGDVVGSYQLSNYSQYGFAYSNGAFKAFSARSANGINLREAIAANICGVNCHGVVKAKTKGGWTAQKVYYPGATSTWLGGINDNGDLSGTVQPTPTGLPHGFVYFKDTNKFFGFNIQGNPGMQATGINKSRQVVGFYVVGNTVYGFYGSVSE